MRRGGTPSTSPGPRGRPSATGNTATDSDDQRARPRRDDPDAYIPGDRRRALGAGTDIHERVRGAAIFADISGFTPLTEALSNELGPQRGAEELTAALDVVFDAILGQLHRFGGTVIYFSGDAVTCWIDGDDGLLSVACGLAMQEAMGSVRTVTTPGGVRVELGMKVAVSAGPARRFVVGDPEIQLIDVLAGSLMDRLAGAEHHAARGEVVVDETTLATLLGRVVAGSARGAPRQDLTTVVRSVHAALPSFSEPGPYPRLPRSVARQWLLPPVYERMRAGRGEFLSELRPAVPMFVRFGGIDFDEDPDAPRLLDDFVRRVQRTADLHGGNVLQLTVGDKGAYLYAVFGSPIAHEDDAARACAAALEVLALEEETAATGLQVGIASGRLRSGTYGHRQRRTFCCLGDAVNLAARLMSAAPTGAVYTTTGVERATRGRFVFGDVGELSLKGKAARVEVRRVLRAELPTTRQGRPGGLMLGRTGELDRLTALGSRAFEGHGQVVALCAEAGMGKSRLASAFAGTLEDRGVPVLVGAATSVGGAESYLAWRPVVVGLLGVPPGSRDGAGAHLAHALEGLDPELLRRMPLLGAVLGTPVGDNGFTSGLDAKARKSSLEALVVQILTRRAARSPVALLLEDCHWLDPLSADLLSLVARAASALPVLVLVTYRPGSFSAPSLAHTTVVGLEGLDASSSRHLLFARFRELYGPESTPSEPVIDRLVERAHGNPFYLEELASYLHDSGADPASADAASLGLPSGLSSLVLSRIDALAEPPRRTLKVASVVGREFDLESVTGAYPELGTPSRVTSHLRTLCAEELIVDESPSRARFSFRHAVVREVAYESLPFSLRARVHGQLGRWLEQTNPGALDLLAHHFWHSRDDGRKREYLLRAAEAARARYANDAAIDYFEKLAPLLPEDRRAPILLELGAVLELPGRWAEAEAVYSEVLQLAADAGRPADAARARVARAEPMRKQGRFEEASRELDAAEPVLEAAGDHGALAQVAHVRGLVATQRGSPSEASEHFQRSLELRRSTGDRAGLATSLANLAVAAARQDRYGPAWELLEESLALRTELDDRWGIQVSHNNLGMIAYLREDYEVALSHFREALRIGDEIGDLLGIATAQHNIGNCSRELGAPDGARAAYAEALTTYSLTGGLWLFPPMFEDVAILVADTDPVSSLSLAGAADGLRDEIGSRRVEFEARALETRLAAAERRSGGDAATARDAGRSLGLDAARTLALALCATAT